MKTRFFGQYLLRKNILTRVQIEDSMRMMEEAHKVLGQLAIEADLLTEEQATALNDSQLKTDLAFGRLAIDKGLLTDSQVESLLKTQKERRMRIGEAAVKLGYLTADALDNHLKDFHSEQKPDSAPEKILSTPLTDNIVVTTVIDLLLKFALRATHIELKVVSPSNKTSTQDIPSLTGSSIVLKGEEEICFGLFCDTTFGSQILRGIERTMCGTVTHPETPDDHYADLLGEILSMVSGQTLGALENHPIRLSVSPPRLHESLSNFNIVIPLLSPLGRAVLGIRL